MEMMNPCGVPNHQIGEGYRLLTREEFFGVHPPDSEYWWDSKWQADVARGRDVRDMDPFRWCPELTFRTQKPLPGCDLLEDLAKLLG
jgi:hypothetical protein